MAATKSAKLFHELAAAWPKDPLRPSVSFAKALEARATAAALAGTDERVAERETAVLRRLVDNDYQKKYTLSPSFTTPVSNPSYYSDLINELQEAPQRSWLASKIQGWKGMLRFS